MTITRRPARPAKAARPRGKSPESFIESAHHQVPETALAEPEPPAAPVAETDAKPAKKGKGKDKEKGKAKEKAKDGKEHKKRKDKEAVLIRFEDEQLTMMDSRAAALGLSRAAWVRMVVAKALMGKKA